MGYFMKKIIFMSIFTTLLFAKTFDVDISKNIDTIDLNESSKLNTTQINVDDNKSKNPKVYAALGDIIFDNVAKIEALKDIELFEPLSTNIEDYSQEVSTVKALGYEIESGNKRLEKEEYLNKLRTLSKEHDFYLRTVQSAYKASMKKNDFELFSKLVNSGLVDTTKRRDEIIEYYMKHSEDINASGVIQNYLEEDKKLKQQAKSYDYEKAKKLREEEKIRRIREEDRKKQAELERTLSEEVKRKKREIIENQKKALFD